MTKKILLFLTILSGIFCTQLNLNGKTEVLYSENSRSKLNVEVHIGDISVETIGINGQNFTRLVLPDGHASTITGEPQLPQIHRLIEIPQDAIPRIEILYMEKREIESSDVGIFHHVFPAQPSLSKSQDADDVLFIQNNTVYSNNNYLNRKLIEVDIIGQMRDVRLSNLIIRPVDYNPVNGSLKVIERLSFIIHFDNADFTKTDEIKEKYYSPVFNQVFTSLDYRIDQNLRDDLINYPITYVILANAIFRDHLDEFIQWKTSKGFHVEVGYTDEVGSNTAALKDYVENLYYNPEDGVSSPSFVLLVGDAAQLPTFSGNTGGHPSDLYYCEFTGDYLPEMYYGRFSAENPNQLQAQIDKTLEYEKYEMPDPSFLGEVVMIAGVDGSYAATYGNGQINYGTDYYFNSSNNIYSHTYLYPTSNEGWVDAQIRSDVSNGVGYVNYTAHGYEGGWADPSFTVSDVPYLNNASKYPLMVGNCCITNQFESGTCFGEALLRAENKGAQGYIGGSNNTYWNEDYWWGVGSGAITANPTYEQTGPGAYDGLFHSYGQNFSQWYTCNSAVIMAGNLGVVQANGWANYYWEIYHLMGDPSLTTYLGIPETNSVSHLPFVTIGAEIVEIIADPYSYAAVSKNGVLHGAGLVGENGSIDLDVEPFTMPGSGEIVITRQNRQPYFGTFEVGNPEGPYLMVNNIFFNGNDENEAFFASNTQLTLTLENIGNEDSQYTTASLTSTDTYITIIDGTESTGLITAGGSLIIQNGFEFHLNGSVPDGHIFGLEFLIQSGEDTWNYLIEATALAPSISITTISVDGGMNGQIDPDETGLITLNISNSGSAAINYPIAEILEDDIYVTIQNVNSDNAYYLDVNESMNVSFDLTAVLNSPQGHIFNGILKVYMLNDDTGFEATEPFTIIIGTPPAVILQIEILTDNYGYETSWAIHDDEGIEVAGFYDGNLANATVYTWDVNLEYGDYSFTIYDSYGDGICCGYGEGNYNLFMGNELIASGGQFGSEEGVDFTIGPGSGGDSFNPPQNFQLSISGSACEAIMLTWDVPEENDTDTDDTGGDNPEIGNPCDSCGENTCIYDCELQCVSETTATNWVGDGYCDDGTWGIYLNCEYFSNDGGDCDGDNQPSEPKNIYLGLDSRELTGYNIYRNNSLLTFTSSTQYADGAIQLGEEYCYAVTAVYTSGESVPTPEDCILALPETAQGDVNFDGQINVVDIVMVVNFILQFGIPTSGEFFASDINGDGELNVIDVILIVNIILDPELSRVENIQEVQIYKSSREISVKADQPFAGIELNIDGDFEVDKSSLNENWILEWNTNKLIAVNISHSFINEIKINLTGSYIIKENIIGDYNGMGYTAKVVEIPDQFSLEPAYPNPFNPATTISFALPEESTVSITIFDLNGSAIESIIDKKVIQPGYYNQSWHPYNIASGVYFIHMSTEKFSGTKKVLFIK